MGKHAFGGQHVIRCADQLVACRDQASTRFVLVGERDQLVGHVDPGLAEGLRPRGVGSLRGFLQRRAHLLDFSHPRAHLDRQIDREVPDIVGGKILEHGVSSRVRPLAAVVGRLLRCTAKRPLRITPPDARLNEDQAVYKIASMNDLY